MHGADIANVAIVPIGKLSEEAAEARNKDFCRYTEFHSRKCSKIKTNQDILNMMLLSSDPLISSTRPVLDAARRKKLSAEALALLKHSTDHVDIEFFDVLNPKRIQTQNMRWTSRKLYYSVYYMPIIK